MHVYIVGSVLKKNKGSSAGQCFAIVWFVKQNVLQKKSVKHMLQNTKKKEISEKKKEKKGGLETSLMNLKIIHKKIF